MSERIAELEATCDEMAATIVLLMHDAHPVYPNTAGWRGGIGGQMVTTGCSIIDPPPGVIWAECDMPTQPARDWINSRDSFDMEGLRQRLIQRWTDALTTPTETEPETDQRKEGER